MTLAAVRGFPAAIENLREVCNGNTSGALREPVFGAAIRDNLSSTSEPGTPIAILMIQLSDPPGPGIIGDRHFENALGPEDGTSKRKTVI